MLTLPQLERLEDRLYEYDVMQGAWEQEPNGFEANAGHVLTHLSKSLIHKDFTNPDVIREEISPDSLQYALRLCRWTEADIPEGRTTTGGDLLMRSTAARLGGVSMHLAAYVVGTGELAGNLHDLEHASKREQALRDRHSSVILGAANMLIHSAFLQSEQYGFDLEEAFDDRLATLRERFKIPIPTSTQTPAAT